MKIPVYRLFRIYLRTFFIQALWNYKSLISLGFCFSLLPIREVLEEKSDAYKKFITDQIQFFNSHPYFASYALGVMARLYEEGPFSEEKFEKIRNLMISPLGALGDKIFWNMIKPTSMMIAVLGGILWYSGYPGYILVIGGFILYNIPHLLLRWIGLVQGYRYGVNIYKNLNFESHKKLYKLYVNLGRFSIIVLFCLILAILIRTFGVAGAVLLINVPIAILINKFDRHLIMKYLVVFIFNVFLGMAII